MYCRYKIINTYLSQKENEKYENSNRKNNITASKSSSKISFYVSFKEAIFAVVTE
jgi:hypothetical protein